MQLKLYFTVSHNTLPLDYGPLFVSFLKHTLSNNYSDYFNELYHKGNALQKSFSFAIRMNKPIFEKNIIKLDNNKIVMTFSSIDPKDLLLFYNSFISLKNKNYPIFNNGFLMLNKVEMVHLPKISSNSINIQFLSPLIVRKHIKGEKDKYFIYNDDEFQDCFKKVASRQFGHDLDLNIIPLNPKSSVILSFNKKLRASLGTYTLTGEPYILNYFLRSGIGSRRSEGFGLFKLIGRS